MPKSGIKKSVPEPIGIRASLYDSGFRHVDWDDAQNSWPIVGDRGNLVLRHIVNCSGQRCPIVWELRLVKLFRQHSMNVGANGRPSVVNDSGCRLVDGAIATRTIGPTIFDMKVDALCPCISGLVP